MDRFSRFAAVFAMSVGSMAAAEAAPPTYDAAWLLPQFIEEPIVFSIGALNNRGEVVGSRGIRDNALTIPFGWSPTLGYHKGHDFPGGQRLASVADVNDSGLGVGTGTTASGSHLALFARTGKMRDLGGIFPNDAASIGAAISNTGEVAGTWTSPLGPAPFVWSGRNGLETFDAPVGTRQLAVTAMNNHGVFVGWYCTTTVCGSFRGRRGSAIELIPGIAWAINDAGQVVGEGTGTAAGLWDEVNGIRNLPYLPSTNLCAAAGINASGVVVGRCDGNGTRFPVVWYPAEGGYTVSDVLSLVDTMPEPMPPCRGGASCFYRNTADAINDLGQIVVRIGAYPYGYIEDADLMLLTPRAAR